MGKRTQTWRKTLRAACVLVELKSKKETSRLMMEVCALASQSRLKQETRARLQRWVAYLGRDRMRVWKKKQMKYKKVCEMVVMNS